MTDTTEPPDGVVKHVAKEEAAICPATTSTAIVDILEPPPPTRHQALEDSDRAAAARGTTFLPRTVALTATTVVLVLAAVGFLVTLHRAGYTIKAKTVEVGGLRIRFVHDDLVPCGTYWKIQCWNESRSRFKSIKMRFLYRKTENSKDTPWPTDRWIEAGPPTNQIKQRVLAAKENSGIYSCEMDADGERINSIDDFREDGKKSIIIINFCGYIPPAPTTRAPTTTTAPSTSTTRITSTTTASTSTEGLFHFLFEETPTSLYIYIFGIFSLLVILSVALYHFRPKKKNNEKKSQEKSEITGAAHTSSSLHQKNILSSRRSRSATPGQSRSRSATGFSRSRSSTRQLTNPYDLIQMDPSDVSRTTASSRRTQSSTTQLTNPYDLIQMDPSDISRTTVSSRTQSTRTMSSRSDMPRTQSSRIMSSRSDMSRTQSSRITSPRSDMPKR